MTETDATQPMRRVRPWIAALLTFVGWGVGFYYARRTRAAVWWAIANVLVGIVLGLGFIGYAVLTNTLSPAFFNTEELAPFDIATLGSTALLAAWAWVTTARTQSVVKGKTTRLWGYFGIWLLPVACGLVLAMSIRFALYQPFRMPSGSMQPTLNVGDYFAVTKWSYGYSRFSVTPFDGLLPGGRIFARLPQRGDLVVFRPVPQLFSDNDLIKRIVGMPGDRVQMRGGAVYINDQALQRESEGKISFKEHTGEYTQIDTWKETLPNGVSYTTFDRNSAGRLDDTPVFEVPPGHYFMLGDDRDNSADSRTQDVAFVPFDHLVGRVDYILRGASPAP